MRDALLSIRSGFLWTLSIAHFVVAAPAITLLGLVLSPRGLDPFLRFFCRNIVRFAGARFEVRRSPGSVTPGPCFYAVNHVDVFDPFLIVSGTDRPTRGLELASHFKVPIYGFMMERLGSVPVPDRPTRAGLAEMNRATRRALDRGISLVVYPEGTRTRSGKLGPFRPGLFRLAVEFQVPIVPVSVVGAFRLKQVGRRRLSPSRVVVHFHDAVPAGNDALALRDHVHEVVNGPLEAAEA
jgi:1-acyl-sn-glycerol-3-phosphate acyltransferase